MWGCQDRSLETRTPRSLSWPKGASDLSLDTEYWYSSLTKGSSTRALRRLCLWHIYSNLSLCSAILFRPFYDTIQVVL